MVRFGEKVDQNFSPPPIPLEHVIFVPTLRLRSSITCSAWGEGGVGRSPKSEHVLAFFEHGKNFPTKSRHLARAARQHAPDIIPNSDGFLKQTKFSFWGTILGISKKEPLPPTPGPGGGHHALLEPLLRFWRRREYFTQIGLEHCVIVVFILVTVCSATTSTHDYK